MAHKLAIQLAFAILAFTLLAPAQVPAPWRYDLRPGDRLVYSYTFRRQVHSDDAESVVEARYHTQVVIAGERAGLLTAGFQRNRDNAELLVYRVKGKDKLADERPNFNQRMQKRPTQFSEAMELTPSGEPAYSWEVARESSSHLLPALHEIEVLAPTPAKVGDRWRAHNLLGIDFQWVGSEQVHGKNCYHVRGTSSDGSVTLSYWWSPESGVIERIEMDGTYGIPGGTSHEQARMELESRSRNATLSDWLAMPEAPLGALEALLLSPAIKVEPDQLISTLKTGSPAVQRLALAVAYQHGQQLPSTILDELSSSTTPEVKILAGAMLNPSAPKPSPERCASPASTKRPTPKLGTLFRVALPEKSRPGVPYVLRIPVTYRGDRPVPLLIYLSGGAGRALDGVNTANDAISATDYLVLYPQAGGYWWQPEAAQRVRAAIDDTLTEFNVDRDRIYIAGFSNGATGALYMAELWPHQFAAVVSLMGAGQCNEDIQKTLPNLTNLPLLFVHGEKDPLIPAACSKETYESIAALHPRVPPQLRLLPNREHDLTLQSDDGLTLLFLKDKVRNPFPRRVSFRLADLTYPRHYWIEVIEKKSGVAEIDAEIKKDNQLDLRTREVKQLRLHLRPEMFPERGAVHIRWNGKLIFEGALQDVCAAGVGTTGDPKLNLSDRKEFVAP